MTTYVPPLSLDACTDEDLVLLEIESRMSDHGVHTIYPGEKEVSGRGTGVPAVVCVVERKGVFARSQELPKTIRFRGKEILLDVFEEEKPKDLRLRLPDTAIHSRNAFQTCYDTPIPGGVQIGPPPGRWVGTFGAAIQTEQGRMLLTNEHVSGMRAIGEKLCQPTGRADWIAEVVATGGVRFDGPNYIDAVIGLAQRTDGKFAPGTYTITNKQLGLGQINPSPVKASVGLRVVKSGRTTEITRGRIVGVNATSRVGYDEGTALFRGQVVIRGDNGKFSAGGDSGSLILTEQLNPVCLLFAGGGGSTIANPIEYVLDWCKGQFF